ncbi:MAG: hypothetical protein ACFB2W_13645 [Leptolyngbyaceae cyanobacterium]
MRLTYILGSIGLVVALASPALANVQETIHQPLPLRLGITFMGIGLIVLELWWFLRQPRR